MGGGKSTPGSLWLVQHLLFGGRGRAARLNVGDYTAVVIVRQHAFPPLLLTPDNMLPVENGQGVFDAAYYAVATSDTPGGPFTTVRVNVTGVAFTRLPDAASIFVDDNDGSGYIAFTHEDSHINNVQQLTPDLLGPLPGGAVSAVIGGGGNEGILMFKRAGTYYIGYGQCCCFCSEGSNVELFAAPAPLGPYTSLGNIIAPSAWGAQTGTVFFTGALGVLASPPRRARVPHSFHSSLSPQLPPQALTTCSMETDGRARPTTSRPTTIRTWRRLCGAARGPTLAAASLQRQQTTTWCTGSRERPLRHRSSTCSTRARASLVQA